MSKRSDVPGERHVPVDVPRETYRGLMFQPTMLDAIRAGNKTATRRLVKASNSILSSGTFERLQLETGRKKFLSAQSANEVVLRARCTFDAGPRVVSIFSAVNPGAVFWTKATRQSARVEAEFNLRVISVDVARLQDMSDVDALAEGVMHLPAEWRIHGTPRDWFARLWDEINGTGTWFKNPWVWIYHYRSALIRTYQRPQRLPPG